MSTIDIDRDAAREAAQNELAKNIYPKPTPMDMLLDWIEELLYRLTAAASKFPGGWYTVAVLVVLLVVALVVAIRIARRAMRSERTTAAPLFGDHLLSAAEHRATAERHAAEADWAPAIRHRVRAVARRLEEDGILDAVPGRTATELARDAGRALPALDGELSTAAETFNDVTYGQRPGTEAQYRMIAALDDELGSHPSGPAAAHPETTRQPWAEVR
ncbi:DUF4129 domain-containing protein [Mycolicibacterium vaccae]|uniref:Protein-glutamine gamma-glutamyltransferase-like C-terminal domain-containing protein n=1 Tax=Mycolicibacterium vaccae ATCC 25954 TaxID=1194972 RepID=K0UU91_MYCVA|nr:DUF4129 domain-containing protein [Mycolicibacterium vaccae]ANI42395.1 membrane protein [Mycolicibacterium vaccae 95051]EJZ10346.1 hypothetical protein MVAC_09232 [Mycolicibacterium vaccae ATCC 25954]MCV7060238.1 DUF4129 domain-containing protein [Mycolicibacterium vaccae]